MSLNFADLVVLGDDLSGIMAGTLLAKRGLSVLVVDHDSSDEPLSLPGLETRIFKSFLGKLAVPEAQSKHLSKNKISFQVILPTGRIDVSTNRDHLLAEIDREFPKHVGWVEDLLADVATAHQEEVGPLLQFLPWHNWREKRRFFKRKRHYGWPSWAQELATRPPELKAFFKTWINFLSGNPVAFADAMQPFMLLSEENTATVTVKGGFKELKNIFYEKIEYHGGTILREAPRDYRFLAESATVKGVELEGYNFLTRCRYLLGNEAFEQFVEHIPKGLRTRAYRQKKKQVGSARQFCMQFLTSSQLIPAPMCQDVLYVRDPSAPLFGANYFQLQVVPLSRPLAPDEDTLLKVAYFLPPHALSEPVDFFEKQHELIERYLRELMPFSGNKLKRVFPLTQRLPANEEPDLFHDPAEDYAQFFDPAAHALRYPPSFNFPGLTTPYHNMLMLGPDQLSWLGLEGRLHSAMKAVDSIWATEAKLRKI